MIPHHIWYVERQIKAEREEEDIAFFECVGQYPKTYLLRLSNTHYVFFIVMGPEDLGFPSTRRRLFGALFNTKTMVWVGRDPRSKVVAHFQEPCFRA